MDIKRSYMDLNTCLIDLKESHMAIKKGLLMDLKMPLMKLIR